jgi:hypothetical protein
MRMKNEPTIALSNPQEQCVTFLWNEMPENYLGYRFLEGQPAIFDQPLAGYDNQPVAQGFNLPDRITQTINQPPSPHWKREWRYAYSEQNRQAPNQLSFHISDQGIAHLSYVINGGQGQVQFVFQPFPQGVRMWATLTTHTAIPGSFCLQQCLRFTGMYNGKWRQEIAHTPFLSELDMQAMGNANGSLTFARRSNQWSSFPVQHVVYPTNRDFPSISKSQGDRVDHSLIVRQTPSRQLAPASYWEQVAPNATWDQFTSGMYWERTAYISNRHPADCLHAWIDFGPLEARQSRTLRGSVYFMEGSKDDLLALWQQNFQAAD